MHVSALVVLFPSIGLLGKHLSRLLLIKLPLSRLGPWLLICSVITEVRRSVLAVVNGLKAYICFVDTIGLLARSDLSSLLVPRIRLLYVVHLLLDLGDVTGVEIERDLFVVGRGWTATLRASGNLGVLTLASIRGLHTTNLVRSREDLGEIDAPVNNRVHSVPHLVLPKFLRSGNLTVIIPTSKCRSFTQKTALTVLISREITHILAEIALLICQLLLFLCAFLSGGLILLDIAQSEKFVHLVALIHHLWFKLSLAVLIARRLELWSRLQF